MGWGGGGGGGGGRLMDSRTGPNQFVPSSWGHKDMAGGGGKVAGGGGGV